MKITKFVFLPLVLATLGFGCAQEYGTKDNTLNPNQSEYSMADRLTWHQTLNWSKDCEDDYRLSADQEDGGLAFYKISEQTYLLRVECYLAVHQKGMIFKLITIDGKNISQKNLEYQEYNPTTKSIEVNDQEDSGIFGDDSFDSKNKVLTIYKNGDCIGGSCGSRTEYKIVNNTLEIIKIEALSPEELEAWLLKHPNSTETPEWPVIYQKKISATKPHLNPKQVTYSIDDRLDWYQTLNWPTDCEDDFRSSYDPETGDLAFYQISNNQYLLRITCSISAYQESMVFMRVYSNNNTFSGEVVDLKTYDPIKKRLTYFDNEGTHQVLGFEKFYPETKTLTLYTKARGLGDCGSVHTYRLTASGLELIKLQDQDCEEIDEWRLNNPDNINTPPWPVIYEKK